VTRPFGVDELLARLRAALSPAAAATSSMPLEIGKLVIAVADRRVTRDAKRGLPRVEVDLVRVPAQHHGRLVTDRQLPAGLWAPECVHGRHELHVLVGNVRTRLERYRSRPGRPMTEPGAGYRLTGWR